MSGLRVVVIAVLLVTAMIATPVLASGSLVAPDTEQQSTNDRFSDGPVAEQSRVTATQTGDAMATTDYPVPEYIANSTADDLNRMTPAEQRLWALSQLDGTQFSTRRTTQSLSDAADSVNRSLSAHTGPARVENTTPFEADRALLRSLQHSTADSADDVSVALVSADRGVAHRQVQDAHRVLGQFEDQTEPGQYAAAEQQLEDARQSLQRADRVRPEDQKRVRGATRIY